MKTHAKAQRHQDRLSDEAMMEIAAEGARAFDLRELELALRHSLWSPLKKYKPSHFAALAWRHSRRKPAAK
jgi:hypothetical protein